MDMIATTFDMRAPFEGWRLRSGDRTVTTKELQWSATSAERRTFERDFQAERMAGLVRGFPNIAVLPDRPPNGMRLSCGAELRRTPHSLRLPRSRLAHKRNSSHNRAPAASSA